METLDRTPDVRFFDFAVSFCTTFVQLPMFDINVQPRGLDIKCYLCQQKIKIYKNFKN